MATATRVRLTPELAGVFFAAKPTQDAAEKTSALLQENHDNHHIFFNDEGFHNHIVHHLLAIYSLGASPSTISKGYDTNASYQLPPKPIHDRLPLDFADSAIFSKHLGDGQYYHDYLLFFQNEISAKGYEAVILEYLFEGDERAEDLLIRLFAGFLHPLIHLGYAVEYAQPALVAEALAQTAVHSAWIGPLFTESETLAHPPSPPSSKTLLELASDARANEKLRTSAHWPDGNKIRDGILVRAPSEMTRLAAQWTVDPTPASLAQKTAEMVAFAAYMTATAQHAPQQVKMDFYYMHAINACPMFCGLLRAAWLGDAQKARLLEWKGRVDLALYVSRGAPKLRYDEVTAYRPLKEGLGSTWEGLFERVCEMEDDGHASKFVRALAFGESLCQGWEGESFLGLRVGDWRTVANMVLDSVEGAEQKWVRGAGFEEAWERLPVRERGML